MAVVTIYRLAEECLRIISGGNIPIASKVHINEIKISCGQVINSLLKVDYFQVNAKLGETIPNGTVMGLYEDIPVTSWRGKSAAKLPVKPIKLPRNMGVWSVFPSDDPDKEFIPVPMGQFALLQSQPLLSNLLNQCGYSVYGDQVLFTKNLSTPNPNDPLKVSMRLAIMDISLYGDFDPLPVLPEMEWQIKQQVCAMYGAEVVADKIVDPGRKEQKGIPINQQNQP